ncbi:FtsQ-type POTRA domain-containing protein [Patescibacteria group bacterium]|nr:FtsQ-type POTRA domain-containing protein [Patescibacteria group bacterium]
MIKEVIGKNEGMFKGDRVEGAQKARLMIYALCLFFLIVGSFWFLFFSKYFDIKQYEIEPLKVLQEDAVIGEIGEFFNNKATRWPWGSKNIFSANTEELEKYLSKVFFVNKVTVDKKYPNILRLKIWERQRSVVFITNSNIYIVDDYGVISELADEATVSSTRAFLTSSAPIESSKEIYVFAPTSTSYEKGTVIANSNTVRAWLNLTTKLRDAGIWFKALHLDPDVPSIVKIILKENKSVVIDVDADLDMQIETLRMFIQAKPPWDDIHEYIDVRVPGRIYYK